MVSQLETLFKCAGCDATVQVGPLGLVLFLSRGDHKLMLALFDRQISLGKARYGDRDTIRILIGLFDVVGRVGCAAGILGQHPVKHVCDTVKANGCTVKR